MSDKPKMRLLGQDGNIFGILGRASSLLRQAGQREQVAEMSDRVYASGSYNEALNIISEYVETELSTIPAKAPSGKAPAFTAQEISIDREMDFSESKITTYVETWFDAAKRFGLALGEDDSCDLYVCYDPNSGSCDAKVCMKYYDGAENWTDVSLSAGEKEAVVAKMEAECMAENGTSLLQTWKEYHCDEHPLKHPKNNHKEKHTNER